MAFPKIKFNKIENGLIFTSDYRTFVKNNTITFSNNAGIAVVYGPNGTGKTSLAKVFSAAENTSISCDYDSVLYENSSELFHVINDQNNRNIISGTAKDFLLGDNIRKEFELQQFITQKYQEILLKTIALLKDKFKISTVSNPLIQLIDSEKIVALVKDLANKNSKGSKTNIETFIDIIVSLPEERIEEFSEEKFSYFINEYSDKKSLIYKILALKEPDITKVHNAQEIEEDSVAIDILTHFAYKTKCIICDSQGIDSNKLKEEKTQHRQFVIDSLTEQMRSFIENILAIPSNSDAFSIRNNVMKALEEGDFTYIKLVQKDITSYFEIFNKKIRVSLKHDLDLTELIEKYNEYQKIISEKPDITEEDFIYIDQILSNSMDKK